MEHVIDTALPKLERIGPFLIEIRFRSRATVRPEGMKEIHRARWKLFNGAPHMVLSIIPHDVEVDLGLVSVDAHAGHRVNDGLRAAALVAGGPMAEMMAKLYYAYYPPHFRLMVPSDERASRDRVAAEVAAIEAESERYTGRHTDLHHLHA